MATIPSMRAAPATLRAVRRAELHSMRRCSIGAPRCRGARCRTTRREGVDRRDEQSRSPAPLPCGLAGSRATGASTSPCRRARHSVTGHDVHSCKRRAAAVACEQRRDDLVRLCQRCPAFIGDNRNRWWIRSNGDVVRTCNRRAAGRVACGTLSELRAPPHLKTICVLHGDARSVGGDRPIGGLWRRGTRVADSAGI